MKITVVGRQMSVTEDLRTLAEKKLAKLDKYFESEEKATVTFSRKRNRENIEITIAAANTLFRCETDDETFRNAIDRAVDTIDRQIRKNKTKLEKRLRKNAFAPTEIPVEQGAEDDENVVRYKTYSVRPMSVEDAILQLSLLGHEFFVFVDADTMKTCVVYARRDGGYGLLTPEK
ncbi:MAG: ribosome-associated translation inhibitor RaiA [Clostridia bacterium]|nr:ribosome-associated translation inhibitor RaiA [Clostridia bacterium]